MAERYSDDRSKGGGGHGGGTSGRWLVSYADFMTLMFVVFIVLYAMAKLDTSKYAALKSSLSQSSIGIQPLPQGGNPLNTSAIVPGPDPESAPGAPAPVDPEHTVPTPPLPSVITPSEPETEPEPKPVTTPASGSSKPVVEKPAVVEKPVVVDPLTKVGESFRATVAGRAGQIDVEIQDRGLVVSVLTSVLFAEGQAELKPGAGQILDQISAQLKASSESLLVEGAPDASEKDAPWDLASRRASAVVGYLVNTHGLAPQRFSVIGYGKGAGVDGIVNVVVLRRQ